MARGVKKGFRHVWGYKGVWDETKTRPGKWTFRFKATKKKKSRGKEGNIGFGILWKIDGYQKARKTRSGQYQTTMWGTKKPVKAGYGKLKKLTYKRKRW